MALTLVPGLGDVLVKTLISYLGSAEAVFSAKIPQLVKVPGIGPNLARSIRNFDLASAEKELTLIEGKGIQTIFYTSQNYPQRLKAIYDSPAMLYYEGSANLNHPRIVAIVGTRNATSHGRQFVRELVMGLANTGVTIGVIASGLDIIYPGVHAKYARKMKENGGLITEYPLRTKLDPARFPARNRIIAGLSDATIVVEAALKGGALITADLASGYDREVFAVPGRSNDQYSAGCNALIKNNVAQLITSAEDLQYYMQWPEEAPLDEKPVIFTEDDFNEEEWAVISTIKKEGKELHIDDLTWKCKINSGQLATILLNLEFRGIVNSIPGKKYSLN